MVPAGAAAVSEILLEAPQKNTSKVFPNETRLHHCELSGWIIIFRCLNRIVNILNRRRVRIKKLMGFEDENDFRRGASSYSCTTTADLAEKM